jgi:hypothetical protein
MKTASHVVGYPGRLGVCLQDCLLPAVPVRCASIAPVWEQQAEVAQLVLVHLQVCFLDCCCQFAATVCDLALMQQQQQGRDVGRVLQV